MVCIGLGMLIVGIMIAGYYAGRKDGCNNWEAAGYLGYLAVKKFYRRLGAWKDKEAEFQALYVNEQSTVIQKQEYCKQATVIFTIAAVALLLVGGCHLVGVFDGREITDLKRPQKGSSVNRLIAITDGSKYEISVTVPQKQWTEEEIRALWMSQKEQLPQMILGKNENLKQIVEDLALPSRITGLPFTINWYSSDYSLMGFDGKLHKEALETEAKEVVLTAEFVYGEWRDTMKIPIIVRRKYNGNEDKQGTIESALSESLKEQGYEEMVRLPENVADRSVRYYAEPAVSPVMLLGVAFVGAIAILLAKINEHRKRLELRKEQMQRDYPDVVNKFTLLLEAGMTIRHAWERIVNDYLRYNGSEVKRYAYEEMLKTRHQLQLGMPETTAYTQFGRCCGSIVYLRFSSVLVQNLEKGTRSIIPLLRKEAEEAMCERKEHARQMGEEAGTKLLLPMAGMLILVLTVVMVPAFMAF